MQVVLLRLGGGGGQMDLSATATHQEEAKILLDPVGSSKALPTQVGPLHPEAVQGHSDQAVLPARSHLA